MIGRTVSRLGPIAGFAVFVMAMLSLFGQAMAQSPAETGSRHVTDGLSVHAHWIIEVREPDGTLVRRREFDNDFVGHEMMVNLLRRTYDVGVWRVLLAGGIAVCGCDDGTPSSCWVVEAGDVDSATCGWSKTLELGASGSGSDAQFVLHGEFEARLTGSVGSVGTFNGGDNVRWTGTTIEPPISVHAGQIVQVIVTMNFS